jgi:hypothetical protein
MADTEDTAQFGAEMKQRFEEFTSWAIEHWPDKSHPLSRTDFDAARKQISILADGRQDIGDKNAEIPEPSEDGPQYVNVNPAPWP